MSNKCEKKDLQLKRILDDISEEIWNYDGQNMIEDGIIDSFDVFSIIQSLEEGLCIRIDPDDIIIENFRNVECLKRLIAKYMKEK